MSVNFTAGTPAQPQPVQQQQSSGKTGLVLGTTIGAGAVGAGAGYFMPVSEDSFASQYSKTITKENEAMSTKLAEIKTELGELKENEKLSDESKKYLKDNGIVEEAKLENKKAIEDAIANKQNEIAPEKAAAEIAETAKTSTAKEDIDKAKKEYEAKKKAADPKQVNAAEAKKQAEITKLENKKVAAEKAKTPNKDTIAELNKQIKEAKTAKTEISKTAAADLKAAETEYKNALGVAKKNMSTFDLNNADEVKKLADKKIAADTKNAAKKTAKSTEKTAEKAAGDKLTDAGKKLYADFKSTENKITDAAKKQAENIMAAAKKSKAFKIGGIAAAAGLLISLFIPGKKAEETSENA